MTHYTALNENHHVGPARLINRSDLRWHLETAHGVHTREKAPKGELGRLHLLLHAVIAHPELAELMDLPEGYGTGKAPTTKY